MSATAPSPRALDVRPLTAAEHGAFLAAHPESSFLQHPAWPGVKTDWRGESLGLFDGEQLTAAALVLYRRLPVPVPGLRNRSLAYIAEGPVFDRDEVALESVITPLVAHLRAAGAFLIRMGLPGVTRRWDGAEVRRVLAAGEPGVQRSVADLEPLETTPGTEETRARLTALGFQAPAESASFEAGQPAFQARIPLQPELYGGEKVSPAKGQEPEDPAVTAVLNRMDSTSRRQTRKSTRSELTVTVGGAEDLPAWQELYEETATRDGFTGRPLAYFQRMFAELNGGAGVGRDGEGGVDSECRLYLAHHGEQLLAAAIYVRQGQFGWYVYGASSAQERKRYAPRALQLRQIEDSLAAGCTWYDLGGMSPSLDPGYELAGLTRFKTTMGADVIQTFGEWDLPVSRPLTAGFNWYMARRGQ